MKLLWPCPLSLSRRHTGLIAATLMTTLCIFNMYSYMTSSQHRGFLTEVGNFSAQWNIFRDILLRENENKKEVRHIVFAKVHKAASTTVMNILIRFGLKNNLTFMLPKINNVISEQGTVSDKFILPTFQNGTYDILCNHVIFNKTVISKYFPLDTKYITILRNPFDQMVSAFMYYKLMYHHPYLVKIPGHNPISTYLQDPQKYEPKPLMASFTNNRMSLDLGFDPKHLVNVSETRALKFIEKLETQFDLVLISDYFDESIILMRRLLGWKLKDIVYVSANKFTKTSFDFSTEDRFRFQRWAWLDIAIYNHFYKVFWRKVFEQGPKFFDEVYTFQSIRRLMLSFCSQKLNGTERFRINETEWNPEFEITGLDCGLMMMKEVPLVDVARQHHNNKHDFKTDKSKRQ